MKGSNRPRVWRGWSAFGVVVLLLLFNLFELIVHWRGHYDAYGVMGRECVTLIIFHYKRNIKNDSKLLAQCFYKWKPTCLYTKLANNNTIIWTNRTNPTRLEPPPEGESGNLYFASLSVSSNGEPKGKNPMCFFVSRGKIIGILPAWFILETMGFLSFPRLTELHFRKQAQGLENWFKKVERRRVRCLWSPWRRMSLKWWGEIDKCIIC